MKFESICRALQYDYRIPHSAQTFSLREGSDCSIDVSQYSSAYREWRAVKLARSGLKWTFCGPSAYTREQNEFICQPFARKTRGWHAIQKKTWVYRLAGEERRVVAASYTRTRVSIYVAKSGSVVYYNSILHRARNLYDRLYPHCWKTRKYRISYGSVPRASEKKKWKIFECGIQEPVVYVCVYGLVFDEFS